MAYEWPKRLLDRDGIPFCKKPDVFLEKTDENGKVIASDTFCTQEAVDKAWAEGFHMVGHPETREFPVKEEQPEKEPLKLARMPGKDEYKVKKRGRPFKKVE
jgi:hypothetical protein